MKRLVYFSILLLPLLGVGINSGGQESKTPADQNVLTPAHILKNYQVVWEDNFDGTTLNTSKWRYRNEGKTSGNATVSRNNIELDGKGNMLIRITKDSDGKYYTGSLDTEGIFETTYGYFECRAAMNKQLGPEVVFRLNSTDYGKTPDPAKDGTMISILQYLRRTNKAYHAVYWKEGPGADRQKDGTTIRLKDIGEGFHTFGLEWTQKEYIFYINGKETWRTSTTVSQHNEYLILSADLVNWGGDLAQGNFPDAITFDYVKVYKPK
ncbi:MAG: family 16 glycosylhydrolase [Mangrovibacterium sp.]